MRQLTERNEGWLATLNVHNMWEWRSRYGCISSANFLSIPPVSHILRPGGAIAICVCMIYVTALCSILLGKNRPNLPTRWPGLDPGHSPPPGQVEGWVLHGLSLVLYIINTSLLRTTHVACSYRQLSFPKCISHIASYIAVTNGLGYFIQWRLFALNVFWYPSRLSL